MLIKDFVKTTFIDYPDKVASLVFTGGCNFRCPYCHNRDLVLKSKEYPSLMPDVVFNHLKKRKGMIDGLVITGGEPTLIKGLKPFIHQVKDMGVKVKLDTNGTHPEVVYDLLHNDLLDYVAMDIKHAPSQYHKAIGLSSFELHHVNQTIQLLMESQIDYEFRTTVAKGLHDQEDLLEIGQWIDGARNYYLQQYVKNPHELMYNVFTSYTKLELEAFQDFISTQTDIGQIAVRAKY